MNTWQLLKQMRRTLLDRTWEGGANKIFGESSVVPTAGVEDEEVLGKLRLPITLLKPLNGSGDPSFSSDPGYIVQNIAARLVVEGRGDGGLGKRALMGGFPIATDRSPGRGLLEVEEELLGAVQFLSQVTGVQIANTFQSVVASSVLAGGAHVALRDYEFRADVTSQRTYPGQRSLQLTDQGGGSVLITWKDVPPRFDRVAWMLRRKLGSAPTSTTDGTLVSRQTTFGVETFTELGVPAGTWFYSIFVTYDDVKEPPVDDRRESPPVSKSVVVA